MVRVWERSELACFYLTPHCLSRDSPFNSVIFIKSRVILIIKLFGNGPLQQPFRHCDYYYNLFYDMNFNFDVDINYK